MKLIAQRIFSPAFSLLCVEMYRFSMFSLLKANTLRREYDGISFRRINIKIQMNYLSYKITPAPDQKKL